MDKIKRTTSLKWSFAIYLPLCAVIAFTGAFGIGIGTNYLQDAYSEKYGVKPNVFSPSYIIAFDSDGVPYYQFINDGKFGGDKSKDTVYFIISNAQFILIPLWVLLCILVTGKIFYNKELKKPLDILLNASKKISENELDFKVECPSKNELGMLCLSFEEMRLALYESNRRLWRTLEERKRLNSAFSHDLRTPLTVLKGYAEYLEKYVPENKVPQEKIMSTLSLMNGQIVRLEHYTESMSNLRKLEDIVPERREIVPEDLRKNLSETGKLICGEKNFELEFNCGNVPIFSDTELILQAYENLTANAARYAKNKVKAVCSADGEFLKITVRDDGAGFTDEALRMGVEPFFRDDKEHNTSHFGLGLYICGIICERCGGSLELANNEGGEVTAKFYCQNR